MSLEKDIRDLTAAILELAGVMREQVTVAIPTEIRSISAETEAWLNSPPGTAAPQSVRDPKRSPPEISTTRDAVAENVALADAEPEPPAAAPLTFDAVKQVFLDIARGAPDPMEGSRRSRAVLAKYGASKLKDVEEAKWPAFVEDCRAAAAVVA